MVLPMVLIVAGPPVGLAQDEPAKSAPPAKSAAPAKEAEPPDDAGTTPAIEPAKAGTPAAPDAAAAAPAPKADSQEVYIDERAKQALANTFPQLHRNVHAQPNDETQVINMASGNAGLDNAVLTRWVQAQTRELTDHKNIQAMLQPPDPNKPNPSGDAEAIERAFDALMRPLLTADQNPGAGAQFRPAYTRALLQVMPELLKNHLFARIEAMLVLSRTADPSAVPTFKAQLTDPDQVVMVKLLAANGLTNLARSPQFQGLAASDAVSAAEAVAKFLENEPDAFWPAKVRALEALGWLRFGNSNPLAPQAEMAAAALRQLADPKAKPVVRAWAAWALGMMRINLAKKNFNFPLVAYHMGQAAVDLGDQIREADALANPDVVRELAHLLVFQVYLGLQGDPNVSGSGLLKQPDLGAARSAVAPIEERVRALTTAAANLARGVQAQLPALRKELAARTEDLRAYLAKNPPASFEIVPGGPTFPAPAEAPEVAAPAAPAPGSPPAPNGGPSPLTTTNASPPVVGETGP